VGNAAESGRTMIGAARTVGLPVCNELIKGAITIPLPFVTVAVVLFASLAHVHVLPSIVFDPFPPVLMFELDSVVKSTLYAVVQLEAEALTALIASLIIVLPDRLKNSPSVIVPTIKFVGPSVSLRPFATPVSACVGSEP